MATLPIKPLDGAGGYLRWKESMLLRLHSVGVGHVLSDDPPPQAVASAEAKAKWARDDAVCRGHILYALSNRIFPDYVRHGTGRAVWEAVARTYDLDSGEYEVFLNRFRFEVEEEEGGAASSSFLEQLAHAEALAATRDRDRGDRGRPLCPGTVAYMIAEKLPPEMAILRCADGEVTMDRIWKYGRLREERRNQWNQREGLGGEAEAQSACVGQGLDRKMPTGGHRNRRR